MKIKKQINKYATMVVFCIIIQLANAQWLPFPTGPNFFGQTDPALPTESIGIGDFNGNAAVPLSALHINSNWLPASLNFGAGEVFRTDCPNGVTPPRRVCK